MSSLPAEIKNLYPEFDFEILARDGDARRGRITTPHGVVETPSFIFCGTKAAIRVATPQQMKEHDTQIILGNTYHLMLQPGAERVAKLGGLHKMMNWDGPMLTDSGGYQVFSMNHGSISEDAKGETETKNRVKITEEGASFRSHIDGKKFFLSPEISIAIQRQLGPDLVVVLDEHTALKDGYDYTASSLQLTHRWALRSLNEFKRGNDGKQALYAVVQGGIYEDLRREGSDFISKHPFFGHALGGCWGKTKEEVHHINLIARQALSGTQPVHWLGIGDVEDIFFGAAMGVDSFDCVTPTRHARHGTALVKAGHNKFRMNLRNARYEDDELPIDESCECYTCRHYSKAYLHHLLRADEGLGYHLIVLHNVFFMNRLMKLVRQAIEGKRLAELAKEWLTS